MPEVLTEAQEALLADKMQKQAERAAKTAKQSTAPEAPAGDPVYTAVVAPMPLAVPMLEVPFLIEPRTLSPYEGLSADTAKAEAAYAQTVDAWKADREKLNAMRNVDDAESVTFADLRQRRDDATQLELALAQQAVGLNRRYVALQQARLPELRDFAAKQAAKLVDVEASVTKRLADAGVSVETQPSWPHAPHSAEIQFSHVIKKAVDWQDQNLQVSQAESQAQSTADFIPGGRLRIGEAEKSLKSKVSKIIA